MGQIFQNDLVRLWKPLFSKRIHVHELATGRKVAATAEMEAKCVACLRYAGSVPLTEDERKLVYMMIFERFASTALHPQSFPASLFLTTSPENAVDAALAAVRGDINDFLEQPEDNEPWLKCPRHELPGGDQLWIEDGVERVWASVANIDAPLEAHPADVRKYRDVITIFLDDPQYVGMFDDLLHELRKLLHKVIFHHRREREFFHETSATIVAERIWYFVLAKREKDRRDPKI